MKRARHWLVMVFIYTLVATCVFGYKEATKEKSDSFDVVVLGGTSSGVIAAVQAAKMGKSVVLIEQGRHLGGLSSGGLGATDIGNKKAIGGMARDFYRRVYLHYLKDDSWVYEKHQNYRSTGERWRGKPKSWDEEKTWWMFEPHVAEKIFRDMIREANVPVVYGERLD